MTSLVMLELAAIHLAATSPLMGRTLILILAAMAASTISSVLYSVLAMAAHSDDVAQIIEPYLPYLLKNLFSELRKKSR